MTSVTSAPTALRVRTSIKAGGLKQNHSLQVRTSVKAGANSVNHGLRVRTTDNDAQG